MNVQKLVRYEAPAYPTKLQLSNDPTLLMRHLPPTWRKLVGAGTAGAMLLGSLAGCSRETNTASPPPIAVSVDHSASLPATTAARSSQPQAALVGLFEHGDGRGAIGCVVISPPSFLTEEEGLQVVKEELAKVGITFDRKNVQLKNVEIYPAGFLSVSSETRAKPDGFTTQDVVRPQAVTLDLYDSVHQISVEFICERDAEKFGWDEYNGRYVGDNPSPEGRRAMSTVSSFDLAKTAEHLAAKLRKDAPAGRYGIFYDPAAPQDRPARGTGVKLTEESNPELRQQVRDFVGWLKDQGVVK